jgi:hypothetical protein
MRSISAILILCAVSLFQTQHQLTVEEESLKQSDHVAKIAAHTPHRSRTSSRGSVPIKPEVGWKLSTLPDWWRTE